MQRDKLREKIAAYLTEYDYDANPMNWREGPGVTEDLRRAAGDPKAFGKKLEDKIKEKTQQVKQDNSDEPD